MAQGNPQPGEIYRHFKGRNYQVKGVAVHSETRERLVIYQALYGTYEWYARPYEMFISPVDHEKYPTVEQTYRFRLLTREELESGEDSAASARLEQPVEYTRRSRDEEKSGKQEEASGTAQLQSGEEEAADPWLIRFMDADTFEEKVKVFSDMRPDITDRLIDEIAMVSDLSIGDGPLEQRYMELKNCLEMRMRFEGGHIRR